LTELPDKPVGVVIANFSQRVVAERSRGLLAQIREPLAAALQNELRQRELDALRATADLEREALLHRMGRESLENVIVGAADGLKLVLQRVDQVARADASVLLLGETGSGKEVIARAIHERSSRVHGPILRVNCGAVPQELIDSELFGHEKGSFTGAAGQRRGWFERADGGTLFLDEIGELPLAAQVRFLRVLQEGVLCRVGGEQPVKVNVRIIAATHRDLAAMVGQGSFREDLWYRIAVFPILIPALRERSQDIPALAHHFAQRAAVKLGLPQRLPDDNDIALLRTYAWPGNVRELATVIERAALLGDGPRLAVAAALGLATTRTPSPGATNGLLTLDAAMTQHINLALHTTHGRIEGAQGAARLLGINPNTLRSRMRKLGVVHKTRP
jgi:transcriptional regulator with GAF, ATPase, and Fis domain